MFYVIVNTNLIVQHDIQIKKLVMINVNVSQSNVQRD